MPLLPRVLSLPDDIPVELRKVRRFSTRTNIPEHARLVEKYKALRDFEAEDHPLPQPKAEPVASQEYRYVKQGPMLQRYRFRRHMGESKPDFFQPGDVVWEYRHVNGKEYHPGLVVAFPLSAMIEVIE